MKTGQFNEQKATWDISCTLSLFCLILYPQLTAWQEKLKGLQNWQIGLRLLLYMNSEHLGEHHGPCPCSTIKKIWICLFDCRSDSNHWSQSAFDSVSRWQEARGHGHMTASFSARKMATYFLSAVTDCWRRRQLKLSTNTSNESNLVCTSCSISMRSKLLCVNYSCRWGSGRSLLLCRVSYVIPHFFQLLHRFIFMHFWLFPRSFKLRSHITRKEKLFEEITG